MSYEQISIADLEKFIDMNSSEYWTWDKSDCSLVGLIRVLLIQEIKTAKKDPWNTTFDDLLKVVEENKL